MPQTAHLLSTLTHAVTAYDRSNSRRRGYNIYALAQYLQAVDRVIEAVEAGAEPRAAILEEFQDRLRDALLRALGQPITSAEELKATNAADLPASLRARPQHSHPQGCRHVQGADPNEICTVPFADVTTSLPSRRGEDPTTSPEIDRSRSDVGAA